jgi:hypothetical protein
MYPTTFKLQGTTLREEMALSNHGQAGPRRERPMGPARHSMLLMTGMAVAGLLSLALSGCGGNSGSRAVNLSVHSGAVGTVVDVSGDAGSGCVLDHNWFGFDFTPYGEANKGPGTRMATPVLKNGSWSASFAIPAYIGGSSTGDGAAISPGRYEFSAPPCSGHTLATASFNVTSATPTTKGSDYVGIAATVDGQGYWLVQADGTVSTFGDAHSYGSLSSSEASTSKIVGMARTYDERGYWLVASDGHVFTFGDAHAYGSASVNQASQGPVTGMAVTPDGRGYWLLSASGHVYNFGDAPPEGSPSPAEAPYAAIGARPAGGYVVTAANDAAAYLFPGDLPELGGGSGTALAATLIGVAVTPSGNGTWQAGLDGGVVTTGQTTSSYAPFYGSVPGENEQLKAPVTGIAGNPDGHGYWLLSADGTVFTFGDAHFFGSGKS